MSNFMNNNPITQGFVYGNTNPNSKQRVDGLPHVCADGHTHASESEVRQCIEAHKVFVCASNHMHAERGDAARCDQIKREEDLLKDKELQRQHEREMMDKQIKMSEKLNAMGWNFKVHGMPQLPWKNS